MSNLYKIYMVRDETYAVVSIPDSEICSYDYNKFLSYLSNGMIVSFSTEQEAISYLNKHLLPEYIDKSYKAPSLTQNSIYSQLYNTLEHWSDYESPSMKRERKHQHEEFERLYGC